MDASVPCVACGDGPTAVKDDSVVGGIPLSTANLSSVRAVACTMPLIRPPAGERSLHWTGLPDAEGQVALYSFRGADFQGAASTAMAGAWPTATMENPRMDSRTVLSSVFVLLDMGLTATAHAARPLNTDDTGVLERGRCESEAVLSRDKSEGATMRGQSLQIGCGVGGRTQLAMVVDQAREDGLRARGINAAGKLALVSGDDASWSLSGAVGWVRAEGKSYQRSVTAINLLHTRSLGQQYVLHTNLGHAQDHLARRSSTTWGAALEHTGWGPWALMSELIGDDLEAPSWNLGLRWTVVPDRWVMDVAYGQQMVGGRPKTFSLGLKLSF